MQEKEIINYGEFTDLTLVPPTGRLLSLDPGGKRIGIAVCDQDRMICSPHRVIKRSSWKKLLAEVRSILNEFDANALVIGLPLESDGSESEMSQYAREMARKFRLSLAIPVFLQDERVSSYAAKQKLWDENAPSDVRDRVDSEAAAIILRDFIDRIS